MADVQETIKRLQSQENVMGVILLDDIGRSVLSTLNSELTKQFAVVCQPLLEKTRQAMKELDPANSLSFFHVRAKKHEIMVSPDRNFSLLVILTPNE
ncbi:dynein light chain [Trichuris trichiura]|uniref:Dynein light chain n=1 Tax=Trichuris trichiura TaxID=36087 RepID=A0A077Z468_TRITR|nr:dynein light chain [Trichuris trichiura]